MVRIVNMRGVNLRQFQFDYDLTWAGFFINDSGRVLGRYGGRDQQNAEAHLSLAGLKHAMRSALAAHEKAPRAKPELKLTPELRVEQYPAAARLKKDACIHCHQVHEFRRDALRRERKWTRDQIWIYPPPSSLGLELDVDQGNRVKRVRPDSPAAKAGIKAGDELKSIGRLWVAS